MRIDYYQTAPEIISRFREITRDSSSLPIDPLLRALVEIRVSQINQCTYCIDLHVTEARRLGEDPMRLEQIPAWHSCSLFTEREKAALAWAEALTETERLRDDDEEFFRLREVFSETEIVALGIVIATANFWNRIAGGFRREPAG